MRVFLSWSGQVSKAVATSLRDWLPLVVQAVEPFMSAEDLEKGSRWSSEIAGELEQSNFGVICLTPENVAAPWIHFEAGALSKSIAAARVTPLLVGLKPSDMAGPLVQFQATRSTSTDVLRMVRGINAAAEHPLKDAQLEKSFTTFWPELEDRLSAAESALRHPHSIPARPTEDVLEELLNLTRAIARNALESRRVWNASPTIADLLRRQSPSGAAAIRELLEEELLGGQMRFGDPEATSDGSRPANGPNGV